MKRIFLSVIACLLLYGLFCSHLLGLASAAAPTKGEESRGAPAARLLSQESASEHWELTARFSSGHLLFVEFLVTNIGWGDRSAAAIGHIVAPDGKTAPFRNGRREGRWQLSSDRLRLKVGGSTLDLHDPQYRLLVNKKDVRVDLRFRADGPALWSDTLTKSGYSLDLLAAAAPVEGTIWTQGMPEPLAVQGVLAATHGWMKNLASSLVLRRVEFFALDEAFPCYGVDLTTPSGANVRWFVLRRPEAKALDAEAPELVWERTLDGKKDPGYTLPGEFRLTSAALDGRVRLEREVLRHDPLEYLPAPFRWLAATTFNLHPRRVWVVSPFTMTMPPTPGTLTLVRSAPLIERQGTGVTAVTFLNPLPSR